MAKPTYIIYKDQPISDSYGQYIYDINNMLGNTGLNTLDTSDDLYSIQDLKYDISENFNSVFGWGANAAVQFETYPLYPAGPLSGPGTYIVGDSRLSVYLVDGAWSTDSDFTSYNSIGTFLSQIPNVFHERRVTPSDGQVAGDDGGLFGFGMPYGWSSDTTAIGWFQNIGFNDQTWLSPYNLNAWDFGCCDDFPIIGFVNESQSQQFLVNQTISNWTDYLEDIQANYGTYNQLSDSTHYFYFIEENHLRWYTIGDGAEAVATTRMVYRYPKTLFIDAWQTGTSITTEVMAWRIYGTGDNWFDAMAGNDECWNQTGHIGTGWTNLGDNYSDYITESELDNTWTEAATTFNCEGWGTWRPTLRLNVRPPLVDIEDLPPYQPFYNMGGKNLDDVYEEQHQILANPDLGGYNIYFNEFFPNLSGGGFTSNYVYNDWRPISNVFIGDDYLTANYLQTYYDTEDINYLYTSAPNIVNLYFTIQDGDNQAQVVEELFGQEYYEKIIDLYQSQGMGNISVENLLSDNNRYLSQNLKFFVTNWDWKEGEEQSEEIVFPYTDEELLSYNFNDDTYIVQNLFNDDGTPNTLQHQYNSPGIKTIKAFVMSTVTNSLNEEYVLVIKSLTLRINLNIDDIYIEDFADIGGPDFTFIPWPYSSPIISGIDDNSQYIQSLNTVIDNNLFSDNELLERNFARKAVENKELGDYLGNVDLEQTRLFLDGTYDMAKLLGIESSYENVNAGTYYTYYPYHKFEGSGRWDGVTKKYPEETSVGSIFISDTLDLNLLSKCLFEFNFGTSDGRTIRDSSGNGNKGILIGDFKVKKESKEIPIRRDSVMKTSETDTQNGAL